jgi:hypothetical protein
MVEYHYGPVTISTRSDVPIPGGDGFCLNTNASSFQGDIDCWQTGSPHIHHSLDSGEEQGRRFKNVGVGCAIAIIVALAVALAISVDFA